VAACHSVDGKGNTRYPRDGVGAKLSVEDLRMWIVLTADDFAFSPSTLDRLVFPSTLLMQYTWRPYMANTVWLKATYLW
jgi:hypothetical protein